MKRFAILFILLGVAFPAVAVQRLGFGLDAFHAVMGGDCASNVVFSPLSFEVDCVVYSEAFGPRERAVYAETMGVLDGLEETYRPRYEKMRDGGVLGVSFFSGRAFCVPDERRNIDIAYRRWLQKTFSAEAFGARHREGIACWFRSRVDGAMEDFDLPADYTTKSASYSYYDLVALRCGWQDPFPTNNTRQLTFHLRDGTTRSISALCDLRMADTWKRSRYVVLRLALAEDTWFFSVMPNEDCSAAVMARELSEERFPTLLTGITSIIDLSVSHEPMAVVMPRLDVVSDFDMRKGFAQLKLPFVDTTHVATNLPPRMINMRTRFVLDERGRDGSCIAEKPREQMVRVTRDTKRVVLNRPFYFFIYHAPSGIVPVVGYFAGK